MEQLIFMEHTVFTLGATDNKKAENNPSQAIKTRDTAHGEIYAMIMMFAAAGYVFFKQRKGA